MWSGAGRGGAGETEAGGQRRVWARRRGWQQLRGRPRRPGVTAAGMGPAAANVAAQLPARDSLAAGIPRRFYFFVDPVQVFVEAADDGEGRYGGYGIRVHGGDQLDDSGQGAAAGFS